eukprot:2839619-Pyramimonas_sp.AAC.1
MINGRENAASKHARAYDSNTCAKTSKRYDQTTYSECQKDESNGMKQMRSLTFLLPKLKPHPMASRAFPTP